jgi:ADP-dependent NAD(P)H-hydrate dehydratase / NAD(P)H-hydrate epimerase
MKIFTANNQLYTAEQIYSLDQTFIVSGVPAIQLMKRAAEAAFNLIKQDYPDRHIRIFCGGGNNAGDGYVLAGLLAQRKFSVDLVAVVDVSKLKGDAKTAYEFSQEQKVTICRLDDPISPDAILVDALLGIGTKGMVREDIASAINTINQSGLPVIALDIPSGLNPDTGAASGPVVVASKTISFIALKQGLLTGKGPAMCGELHLADLQIPELILKTQSSNVRRILLDEQLAKLKPRKADAHKGNFGHVMVIGGDSGYGGAALMAAEAAARTGAGLVSLATRPEHIVASLVRCPEIMVKGVVSGQELEPLLTRPDILVVGPGLGRSPWSEQMLQQAVKSGLPMVLDADALNLLAEGRVIPSDVRGNWILTPHPAEAARLLGVTTAEIQADRFAAIHELKKQYSAQIILKGAGSLVTGVDDELLVMTDGNPGMATGGMGDVLSGILGGLLAQGLSLAETVALGSVLHASAADKAVETKGQMSLMATDLLPCLSIFLSKVDQNF